MQHEFVRWPEVHQVSKLSRSTTWRLERDGKFPQRRQLSANTVGWLRSELDAWVRTRAHAAITVSSSPSEQAANLQTRAGRPIASNQGLVPAAPPPAKARHSALTRKDQQVPSSPYVPTSKGSSAANTDGLASSKFNAIKGSP